jgi:hypothetical protein
MDKSDFTQRRFFSGRQFKLERDGVEVSETNWLNSRRYHVPYECISPKSEQITSANRKVLSASLVFTVITIVCAVVVSVGRESDAVSTILFWGLISTVCWVGFFVSRVSVMVYAQNNGILVLFADIPSQGEVARFVRRLFEARNAFMRAKYGRLSLDQPIAQRIAKLEMLRDQDVISEQEFNRLYKLQSDDRIEPLGPVGFASK